MSPTLTCLALALVGVDLGYRPASNGGAEFIIQINPATLQALRPGEPIGIDVPREAQGMRPSHFSITLGNEQLPHEVPIAGSSPPATLPLGPANPMMSASSARSSAMLPGEEPVNIPPPSSSALSGQFGARPASSIAETVGARQAASPTLPGRFDARKEPSTSLSRSESRFGELQPVNPDGSNPAQPHKPWLGMCLLVIALSASNAYVGWLFLDARQRYRGLLSRTFSFGQQAAEA
ncbi:MAG: hypothetical protein ACLP9L_24070 [Thermoguttaceae bacterium]